MMGDVVIVTLGMSVWYRDREYIVSGVREQEMTEGRSAELSLMEPIYAQRNRMDQLARRQQVEEALRLIPKIGRMADEVIAEQDKKGGGSAA